MFKLRILHQIQAVRPADSTSLRTFEFCNNEPPTGQRGYLIVICCELACSFNGIEIELADFGVGIVEIQGVFWSDNNVLFFRHQLKSRLLFS